MPSPGACRTYADRSSRTYCTTPSQIYWLLLWRIRHIIERTDAMPGYPKPKPKPRPRPRPVACKCEQCSCGASDADASAEEGGGTPLDDLRGEEGASLATRKSPIERSDPARTTMQEAEQAYFTLRRMREDGRMRDAYEHIRDLPAPTLRALDQMTKLAGFDGSLLPRITDLTKSGK